MNIIGGFMKNLMKQNAKMDYLFYKHGNEDLFYKNQFY